MLHDSPEQLGGANFEVWSGSTRPKLHLGILLTLTSHRWRILFQGLLHQGPFSANAIVISGQGQAP